mmetsp:Transcript_33429/g.55334  ORF Transcript_33429/g.55334 Transcript_33429/m.55334 type:complete len:250 (-) Transcript_33429:15-764(-)
MMVAPVTVPHCSKYSPSSSWAVSRPRPWTKTVRSGSLSIVGSFARTRAPARAAPCGGGGGGGGPAPSSDPAPDPWRSYRMASFWRLNITPFNLSIAIWAISLLANLTKAAPFPTKVILRTSPASLNRSSKFCSETPCLGRLPTYKVSWLIVLLGFSSKLCEVANASSIKSLSTVTCSAGMCTALLRPCPFSDIFKYCLPLSLSLKSMNILFLPNEMDLVIRTLSSAMCCIDRLFEAEDAAPAFTESQSQ